MLEALARFGFEIVFGAVGLFVTILIVGCVICLVVSIVWFVGRLLFEVVSLPVLLLLTLLSKVERRFGKKDDELTDDERRLREETGWPFPPRGTRTGAHEVPRRGTRNP
jgi:hypothetical protein